MSIDIMSIENCMRPALLHASTPQSEGRLRQYLQLSIQNLSAKPS